MDVSESRRGRIATFLRSLRYIWLLFVLAAVALHATQSIPSQYVEYVAYVAAVLAGYPALYVLVRLIERPRSALPPQRPTFLPSMGKTSREGRGCGVQYVAAEMQGWRDDMEDATVCRLGLPSPLEGGVLFAVFDGHGGKKVAELCAQLVEGELLACAATAASVQEALRQTFISLDRKLLELGTPPQGNPNDAVDAEEEKNSFDAVGSTACVVLVLDRTLYVANAGDSRAFLCRSGTAIALSRDHKPESPRERKRIERAGGKVMLTGPCYRIDRGLNVSRSLGDFAYKRNPELREDCQKISPVADVTVTHLTCEDEFLVIGCDGIFELCSSQDLCNFIRQALGRLNLLDIAEQVLDMCCSKNPKLTFGRGRDNESVVLLRFDDLS
jgi:serine/threonine protein phosphatase PrpC